MSIHRAARLALVWAFCAYAETGFLVQGRLNHTLVQQAYLEADWNGLAKGLESFLRNPAAKADGLDSLCALKYLAVIHASRPETRLLGEENFNRLLELAPSFEASGLANLFVSDEVITLFLRVKREFRQAQLPSPQIPGPGPATATAPGETGSTAFREADSAGGKRGHTWVWVGAGGAAVVGALTAYFFLAADSEPATHKIPVEL